jgi:glutamine synthetase
MKTQLQALQQMGESKIEQVRLAWCDLHGDLRGKTLMPMAVAHALTHGISLVGTLALKDSSDRTAYPIFSPQGAHELPDFAHASNLTLRPNLASYQELPWVNATAWLQGQLYTADGRIAAFDTRHVLQTALAKLAKAGFEMQCGLEIEFHIYKIDNTRVQSDPNQAFWGAEPPAVSMIHPGYRLLSDQWMDMADEPLSIVRSTCKALGLPLTSLEVEFGPSQVEAVFNVCDALTAADHMVLFRSAVKQALRRAGYHATFMCRPPFPSIMSSGWHLHQSLVDHKTHENVFKPLIAADKHAKTTEVLSTTGQHYLAGLLAHAAGCTALSNPTINAYDRFAPGALAPQSIVWGVDNRGAMLRVIAAGEATRIENRAGEPLANPYLYMASQIYAGLDGIKRQLELPLPCLDPYASNATKLPTQLPTALAALKADKVLLKGFGSDFIAYYQRIKEQELRRFKESTDPVEWMRREYFSRY